MVKFCNNCGSIMMPQKDENGVVTLFCKKCETTESAEHDMVLKSKVKSKDKVETVVITSPEEQSGSTQEAECPECQQIRKVTVWQVQTRSADEAMTTFYKCLSCQNTWRDYGG